MSDGPHKSLPMPPAWKRVAERADNAAFESDEIRKALIPALEHDCRTEMSPALLDDVRSLIEGQDASLFKSDVRPQLEALRTDAGYGIGNRLLNNLIRPVSARRGGLQPTGPGNGRRSRGSRRAALPAGRGALSAQVYG